MPHFEPFFDSEAMNERLPRAARIVSIGALLVAGIAGLTVAIVVIRDWSSQPHPEAFLVFVLVPTALAFGVALRLALGKRIANPVVAPPRPFIVRALGLLLFVFAGAAALVSEGWPERIGTGTLALTGLAWFLRPPRRVRGHDA
jgi:hypothetical protein